MADSTPAPRSLQDVLDQLKSHLDARVDPGLLSIQRLTDSAKISVDMVSAALEVLVDKELLDPDQLLRSFHDGGGDRAQLSQLEAFKWLRRWIREQEGRAEPLDDQSAG